MDTDKYLMILSIYIEEKERYSENKIILYYGVKYTFENKILRFKLRQSTFKNEVVKK